jgi:hypothetical protein
MTTLTHGPSTQLRLVRNTLRQLPKQEASPFFSRWSGSLIGQCRLVVAVQRLSIFGWSDEGLCLQMPPNQWSRFLCRVDGTPEDQVAKMRVPAGGPRAGDEIPGVFMDDTDNMRD